MKRTVSVMLVASLWGPSSTHAAHEFPTEVVQPIITAQGVFPKTVCYTHYFGTPLPGWAVAMVTRENCLIDDLGEHSNRNAANLLGFKSGADPFHSSGELYGDTVRVWLDLSELEDGRTELKGEPVGHVIDATIEAVIATAYKCRRGQDPEELKSVYANYVAIEVRGKPEYRNLSKVVSFAEWLSNSRE